MKKCLFNKFFILGVILFVITPHISYAEYRVYQYYVKSRLQNSRDNEAHLVTSTLDPISYLSYHGGRNSIKVDLIRTWICPGFTGMFKKICDGPLEKLKELNNQMADN